MSDQFMTRALELARRGRGAVEPNPMVGAVIVRDGQVLGEGFHQRFGGPHAEVEAIAAAGERTSGATMVVTLEPCCHEGKTGPCTEAILEAKIAHVVVAMEDPDARAAGKGLEILRAAGVDVTVGVCEVEARRLLAPYVKLRTMGRPWVICKWAQSLDGRIATHIGDSKWISGEASRARVHELRGLCDGICVGAGTIAADDPLLTNRSGAGSQPARIVLDGSLAISPESQLVRTAHESPVIVATRKTAPEAAAEALTEAGVEVLRLPPGAGHVGVDLPALLNELGGRGWTHLLVEGGRMVLENFIGGGLADELMVFIAPVLIGGSDSIGPVRWGEVDTVEKAPRLPAPEVEGVGDDVLLRYFING